MKRNNLLLSVKDLKTYFFSREGTVKAVDGVDFDIHEGQTLGIAGESGCGKSVTAQSILRIVPENGRIVQGTIILNRNEEKPLDLAKLDKDGKEIRRIRGAEIAMVFQEPMASFSPVYTIGNQIMEAIVEHQKCSHAEAKERSIDILNKVGMPKPEEIISSYTFNLSGGMRQRAMIAMALSCQPRLLIADEPTTAVDVTIQAQVLDLIKEFQSELNMSLMIITHDLAVIAELAENVLIMYLGKGVEWGSSEEIFYSPKHPYTKGLLASMPRIGEGSRQSIEPITGSVPNPYEMPSGCPFHPRCSCFMPGICDKEEPSFVELESDHKVSCFLFTR